MIEIPTNAVADVFRAAYPDTPPEAIEPTFRDWWDKYQAFYYDDNEAKTQKRDYQEALDALTGKKRFSIAKIANAVRSRLLFLTAPLWKRL